MHTRQSLSFLLIAGFIFSGCSSTPKTNATLDEARANYAAAQADPAVVKYAPIELKEAGDALAKADGALKDREKPAEVDHLAYIAKQKVAITQQLAQLKTAEETMKTAAADRDKVLLQTRTMEADRLRNELNAKQTDRGLTITLGDVLFDTNKSQLKPGGMRTIQKLGQFLQENPQRKVSIEGFTDSRGSDDYNQTLSERRADAVRAALVDQGISSDRIATHGYGKAFPVAGNETSAGQQLNRRVEIVVSEAGKDIAPR
ncbi:MAG TPA: OmpA family protein [Spongiibacteraceae bacterium]|jgi:outer membrane protein OmpA-like peptidoglycan-associated protein